MAIEIKRTPVLKDVAATTFMKKVRSKKSRASSKKVKASLSIAKKILTTYKKSA
jgi:hypothetical protein